MATTQQSGFAPAASPLASTIVQTPDDAIVAGFTSIPSQGDNMPAYHARPKQSDGPLPVVIVVQEIFGVHEHIRDICRRLALEGYLAIAPELYFREGDPNDFADIPTLLREVAIKWSAAPDMTPQTVLYRRPVAQFSNFQPKIVSSWLILALFQANFLISGRSRLCPYQLVNSNQVRQGE